MHSMVSSQLAQQLIPSLLAAQHQVRVTVTGRSMAPYLDGGEELTLAPVMADEIHAGDLVAVRAPGSEALVIHRIIKVVRATSGTRFFTKGDGNPRFDEPVCADRVLGKVAGILHRDGRLEATSAWSWRAAASFRAVWSRIFTRFER